MKRAVMLAAAVVALACAGVAVAANGTGNGNGNTNKSPNGAQTASFQAVYDNPLGGHLTCSGERISKAGSGGFVKDNEQCTVSDPASFFPSGRNVGTQDSNGLAYITLNGLHWYWFSDYDGQYAKTLVIVVSGGGPNGTAHISVTATY